MAAPLDLLEPPVPPVKLEPLANEEKPEPPAATETAHLSLFRLPDAVCAPMELTDPLDPLDPLGPMVKPANPATLEAMEPPETLEPLEAPEPLEMLGPLDPLDQPEHPALLEPGEDPDLLDPRDHLDPPAQLDSLAKLDRMVVALLDPKELPDLLARLEAMETQDPRDLLELLGLLDRTPNIALALVVEENEPKVEAQKCRWDVFGLSFSLVPCFSFLFVFFSPNGKKCSAML